MAAPNIPAAKRVGLGVDLDRLADEGDGWLTPEDRYALKTWGVCTQAQDHVFMVRIRIPGGVLPTAQARGVARLADRSVRETLAELERVGLSTRSACGHTLRRHVLRGRRRRARRAVRLPQRRPRRERCDPRPIRRAQLRAAEPYQRRLRRIPSVSGGRLDGASRFSGV